jgi:hypothetical protein
MGGVVAVQRSVMCIVEETCDVAEICTSYEPVSHHKHDKQHRKQENQKRRDGKQKENKNRPVESSEVKKKKKLENNKNGHVQRSPNKHTSTHKQRCSC